ncbi:MAG TPA: acyl-CoA reductase [Candidatus Limnocylindrales bacterium]|nr:acyl-CoA reductase [Candidatus Limnocylindrales bacterium]
MNAPPDVAAAVESAVSSDRWDISSFVATVTAARAAGCAFGDAEVRFCTSLAAALLGSGAGRNPQLVSLGYWLRPASVERMRDRFARLEDRGTLVVPRGRVFQVAPANVDTLFAYSWVLGLLGGNASVVRVSNRTTELTDTLLAAIRDVLDRPEFAELRGRNWLVRTPHDDATAAALSSIADVRVVWGGDATVEYFRRFPLPPRGRDIVFPNRHSLAIIDAAAIARATDEELAGAADAFFNDAYWFDQGACSSPRLVLWRAADGDDTAPARHRFKAAVGAAIGRRAYEAQLGAAINKMAFGLRAAARVPGVVYERLSNEATWIELPDLAAYDRDNCGGGLFFEFVSRDVPADLAALVGPEDQTAACYGIDRDDARSLARRLNGRGIDRWVRLGRALDFDATWDGYDLLQEFVKRVAIEV